MGGGLAETTLTIGVGSRLAVAALTVGVRGRLAVTALTVGVGSGLAIAALVLLAGSGGLTVVEFADGTGFLMLIAHVVSFDVRGPAGAGKVLRLGFG